ncbi:Outer membrane efflux protein [mine drainage metagenome]|uniref:Outer membrane efflux protein n=1 Tax=mine drainage metagenome TaxID=410659 RepID=T0ZX09_9ZZZZ
MKIPTLSEVAAPTVQESMGKMLDFQRNEFQDSVFNIGMGLSWPLYAGGRLAAGVRAARADSRAAAYRLSGIRQKLAFAVTQTYLGIGVAKRSEQAVQASVRHLSAAETNLQEFVRVGKRPRLDLLRVQARLEQTRQLLADTQAALVTVRGNLRRLLDLDPSGPPLALAAPNGTPDVTLALQPLAAAIHTALLNRPDYRALLSGVEARRAQVSIAEGARLPTVTLAARAWEAHGNRTGAGLPYRSWEPDSQIMLSVSVPVFNGGTLRAEEHRERARLEEIDNRLTGLAQRVRLQVIQAYAELRAARTELLAARAGRRSADEAFRVERQKTTVGAGTVTDLLDVQAADLSAQTSFYQAEADLRVAAAHVELVTGVLDRLATDPSSGVP